MARQRKEVRFQGAGGQMLAGLMEMPENIRAYALFAHCFTCSKDVAAASRISRGLAQHDIAVLRFDFTGLGNSDGDFANTNFSSNVGDLVAAADHLRDHFHGPALLVGHSLGGAAVLAAVLAAADKIPECRAVATIGAPATPQHVRHLFAEAEPQILTDGEAEVSLAGRQFTIKHQFIQDLSEQKQEARIARLGRALAIFHSPDDVTVSIDEAARIYSFAKHPKTFICLDGADHLLARRADSEYVAAMLATWVTRYL